MTNDNSRTSATANRLASASSPYLLQHADNPVDWYPWGREAFEKARCEGRPIFLSIGYSSCHWCHVMAHESFEDAAVAAALNRGFVSIKVDREERPDVDEVYMHAVQMMTGSGGWPLSVFLTPEGKPFYGGTYFPPEPRHGLPGFSQVLRGVLEVWRDRPAEVRAQGDELADAVRKSLDRGEPAKDRAPGLQALARAASELEAGFDARWGGFSPAPKFPPEGAVALLLRRYWHEGDERALGMAERTLEAMACGGIHDQVGGGFHRYSVDARWLVPHFEKMLYDNALLASLYVDAWRVTGRDFYARTARDTLDYLLRDMTDVRGGLHSAEDADSEGGEGRFYTWTPDEMREVLGPEEAQAAGEFFGVEPEGNFEGRSILHMRRTPEEAAEDLGMDIDAFLERVDGWRRALRRARSARPAPGRDDKVLAAWNGMAVSALCAGAQAFGETRYAQAARCAADFILAEMWRDGRMLRTWRAGQPGEAGYLDDYAAVANSLVDVYEITLEVRYAEAAVEIAEAMLEHFTDPEGGAFYYSAPHHDNLIARSKPLFDGPTPSANAEAARVLLRLARLTGREEWAERAEGVFRAAGHDLERMPRGFLDMLTVICDTQSPGPEIVLGGARADSASIRSFAAEVGRRFLPGRVVAFAPSGNPAPDWPLLEGRTTAEAGPRVWVCRGYVCGAPARTVEELVKALDSAR